MTKTLTEQWREGTLKSGNYYTVCYKGWSGETFPCNLYYSEILGFDANVKEVLAPVPSYDKVKEMSQKIERLEFDNEALEMAYNESVTKCHQLERKLEIATKALSDIEDGYSESTGLDKL